MRFLFLIDDLGSGGAQRQMTILARNLADKGHHIDFVTYFENDFFGDKVDSENIERVRLQKKEKVGWNVILKLRRLIRENSYHCILSFLDTPNFYAVISKLISFRKTPVIVSERSFTDFASKSNRLKLKIFVHKRANWMTANSNHEYKRWVDYSHSFKNRASCIYNCVDVDKFSYVERRFNAHNVLVVASICPFKNGMCLIEALNYLKQRDKLRGIKVTWIGAKEYAIKSRKEYIELMERKISEYGLHPYWEWIAPTPDIDQFYAQADVLVHPSKKEGLPNAVCEALSSGLPIIVSDLMDHPILCDHGRNGFLFDADKPRELASTLLRYFELDKREKQKLSLNARKFAVDNFSEEIFARRYLDVFSKVAKLDI